MKDQAFPSVDEIERVTKCPLAISLGLRFLFRFRLRTAFPQAYWDWLHRDGAKRVNRIRVAGIAHLAFLGVMLAPLIGDCVYGIPISGRSSRFVSLLKFAFVLTFFVIYALRSKEKLEFARYLAERNGLLCWSCGYDLNGLPDGRPCPECGTTKSQSDIRAQWLDWLSKARQ